MPRGSIFGLWAQWGGKSTFINILAGMVVKSGGSAEIWGFDIDKTPPSSRLYRYCAARAFHRPVFYWRNHGFAGRHVWRAEKPAPHVEILTAMGLDDKLMPMPALCRAACGGVFWSPKLWCTIRRFGVDEPTAGVDIELRRQLWDYVLELNKAGVTIVLTTHYLEEAEELCDTIGDYRQGELRACDTTQNLLAQIDNKTLWCVPHRLAKRRH